MSIGFKQNPDGSWYSYKIERKKREADVKPASLPDFQPLFSQATAEPAPPSIFPESPNLSTMNINELRVYAVENNIDISAAKNSQQSILTEINKALADRVAE